MSRAQVPTRRYGPFDEFSTDIERMFDSVLGRTFGTMLRNGSSEKYVPVLDLAETPEAFEVRVDLPGVKPEDVKVELHEGQLVVSGTRDTTSERTDKNVHYVERASGSFMRTVGLPSDINGEKIDAQYKDGVLHITLPKSAKAQPKKIEIRTK
jgi:HSP20 family protein